MRNLGFIASLIFILLSCSIAPYSTEKNCSERGLSALRSDTSPERPSEEYKKVKESVRKFYRDHSKDLQICYQEYLDNDSNNRNDYAVCTVLVVNNGKLTFLDIADRENDINSDLKNCLESKFHSFDYKFIQDRNSYTIEHPINFHARRQ